MDKELSIPEEIYVARDLCVSCGKASAGFLQCETCWGNQISFITAPQPKIETDFNKCLCGGKLPKGKIFCDDCVLEYNKNVKNFNLLG